MKKRIITALTASALTACTAAMPLNTTFAEYDSGLLTVGYLPDWSYSAYKDMDMSALTHLNISFCNPDENGDLFCWIPKGEMTALVEKAHDSGVKVMAALGGGGGCDDYLQFIDTPEEMAVFSGKIIEYCRENDFDGIDLDIELPSKNAIWDYYGDWVAELRRLCDENGYELSTATAQWVAPGTSDETFELFDFINVMAYDNDLSRTNHAGMDFAQSSLDYFCLQRRIPREKLILGVPFYGRGYAADGSMDWGVYMSFANIIAADSANYDNDVYNGIAYNGAPMMREKCALAKEYGGIMIWELSQDAAGEYSLLSLIKDELSSYVIGDANGDGEFGVADLVTLSNYLMGTCGMKCPEGGDISGDGIIDTYDLVQMRREIIMVYETQ